MKLDIRSFALASGVITAALTALCFAVWAVAPEASAAFFGYVMHMDLTAVNRTVTLGSFIGGVAFWGLTVAAAAALLAWFYNRLVERAPAEVVHRERAAV
jgi:hypothetical protein